MSWTANQPPDPYPTYHEILMRRKKRRRKNRRKNLIFLICLCLAVITVGIIIRRFNPVENTNGSTLVSLQEAENNSTLDDSINALLPWNLQLINASHALPEDFDITLHTLQNGLSVDERIYDSLAELINAGNGQGLHLIICSAYRPMDRQIELFEQEIANYQAAGNDYETAYNLAKTAVAVPGTSEHTLGLAVDICALDYQILDEGFEDTPEGTWLRENAHEYGFILRYPKDKQDITGIMYEPWHFRYVGKEHAQAIKESGLCLEEYVEQYLAAEK